MGKVAQLLSSTAFPTLVGSSGCAASLAGGNVAGDCHCEMQEVEDTGSCWSFISGFVLVSFFFSSIFFNRSMNWQS